MVLSSCCLNLNLRLSLNLNLSQCLDQSLLPLLSVATEVARRSTAPMAWLRSCQPLTMRDYSGSIVLSAEEN